MTDKDGTLVIDLHDFAETDRYGWGDFACWASLLVAKDGYRVYETGMARLSGADVVQVASQPLNEKPYFRKASFNDFDIQYSKDMDFAVLPGNRESHSVGIKFATTSSSKVKLGYWHKGKRWQEQEVTPQNGIAEVTLSHADLLYRDDWNSWELEANKAIEIRATQDGVTTKMTPSFRSVNGVIEKPSSGDNQQVPFFSSGTLKDVAGGNNDLKIVVPAGVPLIGGLSVKLWAPVLPFTYSFDPAGYAAIGFGTGSTLYARKDGRFDPDGCKKQPRKSIKEQWKKMNEKCDQSVQNYKDARTCCGPFTGTGLMDVSSALKFGWSAGAGLFAEWDIGNKNWKGGAQASVGLAMSYEFSLQYSLGPVPAYISFEFGAGASVGIKGAMAVQGFFERFDFSPSGGQADISISLYVGAGIGIEGLASIGVRGGGYISTLLGYYPKIDKPQPHFAVQVGCELSWVVQIFISKWSGTIVRSKWPSIYDNWASSAYNSDAVELTEGDEAFMFRLDDFSLGFSCPDNSLPGDAGADPSAGFVLVKNSELAETKELVATQQTGGTAADELDVIPEFSCVEYTGDGGSTTLASCAVAGALSAGEQGVKPTTDTIIYKDVFSAPQIKSITDRAGQSYLFRILTVEYPDGLRSRLSVARFDKGSGTWGKPQCLEFPFQCESAYPTDLEADDKRIDTFDYDFDVSINRDTKDNTGVSMYVHLISGTRPDGDNTKLTGLFSAKWYSTHIQLDADGKAKRAATKRVNVPGETNRIPLHPFVTSLNDNNFTPNVLYGYLIAEIPDGLTPFNGTSSAVLEFSLRTLSHERKCPDWKNPIETTWGERIDQWERPTAFYTCYYQNSTLHTSVLIPSASAKLGSLFSIPLGSAGDSKTFARRKGTAFKVGYYFGKEGFFHLDEAGELCFERRMDNYTAKIGPRNFAVKSFAVSPDGRWLYLTKADTGPQADTIDENNNHSPKDNAKLHMVYASHLASDKFSEPFAFCELAAPADDVVLNHLGNNHEAASVIYQSITDMTRSASNIHCAVVPFLRYLVPTAFYSHMPLVGAGKEETFYIEVRNDGNTLVSACVLELLDGAGNVFQEVKLDCMRANVMPDQMDALQAVGATVSPIDDVGSSGVADDAVSTLYDFGEAPVLDEATESGVLVPGRRRVYKIAVTIPDTWRGKQTIQVQVKKGSIDIATLDTHASGEDGETVASALDGTEIFEQVTLSSGLDLAQLELEDETQACNYSYEGSGDDDADDNNKKGLIPSAGDPTDIVVPGIVAVAGTGLAAYSARRSRLERNDD